jgi:aminopeptidase
MNDPRISELADVLIGYSVNLKKGQTVYIAGTFQAAPLIKELYRKAIQLGAFPSTQITIEGLDEIYYKYSSDEQLKYIPPARRFMFEKADSVISIISDFNTKTLSNIDPQQMVKSNRATAPMFKKFMKRTALGQVKWVGCQYPTLAAAQDATMSLSEYEDFVFRACRVDRKDPVAEWKKMSAYNARLIKYLAGKDEIRIVAKDTDLRYRVAGRKWINCDGKNNFPDGEVFTAPIENSAEGHIRFTYPAEYSGREAEDVRIEFKNGKAVSARAVRGEEFLNAMLDTDKGARYLGEVAIGTNFGIAKYTRNTLFDEKIGGTVHMALGESYPESGGKNNSGIHWDMVCDLRDGGELYADGQLFMKNGKFLK